MTDVITLNRIDQPCWQYILKTFVNICGNCGTKQIKFQQMENKLMEMEKHRMEMFLQSDNNDDEDETDYEELKEHLKMMNEDERMKYRNFETLRNLANGLSPNYKMEKINKAIKELKEEEDNNDKNQKRTVNSQLDGITLGEFRERVKVIPVSESESEEEDKQSDMEKQTEPENE